MTHTSVSSGIAVDDPIFAAIDEANTAEAAHFLACERLDEGDDVAMRACNAAADRASAARQGMMRVMPTTLGGLRALAGHYVRWGEQWAEDSFIHIVRSLDGCDPSTALRAPERAP